MIDTQSAIDEFLLSRRANGVSENTVRWYQSVLTGFAAHFPTLNASTSELRQYIVDLRGRLAPASVIGHVTALHVFWKWAADEYQRDNPMRGIRRPRPLPPQPKGISPADFVRLLEHASIRDAALLCFLADTGARLGGVVGLTLDRLDIERRYAIVTEKGRKHRRVYFTTLTARMLRRWLFVRDSEGEFVFTNAQTGAGLTGSGIAQLLKRLKRRAGVKGRVNPHAFRHGFAREYVQDGGDITTLARLLGHENVTTTAAYYAVFSDDELQELHAKHTPMKRLKKR